MFAPPTQSLAPEGCMDLMALINQVNLPETNKNQFDPPMKNPVPKTNFLTKNLPPVFE
jgi:hypothetical protein